ncbi:hypothetical protein BKA70DRAFT_1427380 [Coprinopsis sp. MPI-PUGE-AT-0042]|nr:hypothetical protein BKA70DRAFT_1427380 [Coprinopsis sp. MPI-PUGE-AT-0042]
MAHLANPPFQLSAGPSKALAMSSSTLAATVSSRAAPHCRTCRKPMKGHPKKAYMPINGADAGSISQPSFTPPPELGSISSTAKGEYSLLQAHGRASAHTSTRQLAEETMSRVEDLAALLLGVDYPVNPARAHLALSLLRRLEAMPEVENILKDVKAEVLLCRRWDAQRLQVSRNKKGQAVGFLWAGITHLLVGLAASGLTLLLLAYI